MVPSLNGRPFLEVPPLHSWCVALVYRLLGCDPPTLARIVSALFGLGGLWCTFLLASYLARRSGEEKRAGRVGLLAALCLGLCAEYLTTAHRVVVDGALTFFTTASAYALIRGLTAEEGRRSFGWFLAGYALATLAFLSKGALGIVFPALAYFAVVIVSRRPRLLVAGRLWLAPIVFAAIAGPWLYLLWGEAGWEAVRQVVVVNTLGRALPVAYAFEEHSHPFYYYLLRTPLGALPTTLFAIGAVFQRLSWRRLGGLAQAEDVPLPGLRFEARRAYDLCFWWFGLGFVLLSAATTKRSIYAVPLFPAVAVASGFWLDSWLAGRADGRYEKLVGWLLAVSVPVAGVAAPVAAAILGRPQTWTDLYPALAAPIGVGAALLIRRAIKAGAREGALELWLAGALIIGLIGKWSLMPVIDRAQSLQGVTLEIVERVPVTGGIHVFTPDETTEAVFPLYAGRPAIPIPSVEALERLLETGREVYVVTVDRHEDPTPPEPLPPGSRIQYARVRHLKPIVLLEDHSAPRRKFRLLLFAGHGGR